MRARLDRLHELRPDRGRSGGRGGCDSGDGRVWRRALARRPDAHGARRDRIRGGAMWIRRRKITPTSPGSRSTRSAPTRRTCALPGRSKARRRVRRRRREDRREPTLRKRRVGHTQLLLARERALEAGGRGAEGVRRREPTLEDEGWGTRKGQVQLPGPSAAADDLGMTASVRERATRPGDGTGTAQRDSPQRLRGAKDALRLRGLCVPAKPHPVGRVSPEGSRAARLPSKASVDASLRMT